MATKARKITSKANTKQKAKVKKQNKENTPQTTSNLATYSAYDGEIDDGGLTNQISNLFINTPTSQSKKVSDVIYNKKKVLPTRENLSESLYKQIFHSNGIYLNGDDIKLYNRIYRYGFKDPFGAVTTAREFLFFTKPDLHILQRDEPYNPNNPNSKKNSSSNDNWTGKVNMNKLNYGLENVPFWVDLMAKRRDTTIKMLQSSITDKTGCPYNTLLMNQVKSQLDVPSLEAEAVELPTNAFGISYSYRLSAEASDDNPTFSLEFKDNKWLDTYYFFKAYEEYEKLKRHGAVRPYIDHIINKTLHDAFSIYKIIVGEDMETILYWGKYYGVMPMSLPREVFADTNFDGGLSYSVNFKAAFYEDMIPDIIADFNNLGKKWYDKQKYQISIHNTNIDAPDMRAATAAYIVQMTSKTSPTGYVYKLKWKGADKV